MVGYSIFIPMTLRNKQKGQRRFSRSKRQRGGTSQEDIDNFMLAAINLNETDKVQYALEKGANANATDDAGSTALILATTVDRELVELLLEHGAEVNATDDDGRTALMVASENGDIEIVRMLLANGADVNAMDDYNETAFMISTNNGHDEIAKLLLPTELYEIPQCMSTVEYQECVKSNDGNKPIDPISLNEVDRKDAVKLPGQPGVCYNRNTLKKWFRTNKTNPITRKHVDDSWILENMGDQPCVEKYRARLKRRTMKKRNRRKSTKKSRSKQSSRSKQTDNKE